MGAIAKYVGLWALLTVGFAFGNQWRLGDADWWNSALWAAVFIGGSHFYSTTLERLDRLELELRRLRAEFDQLTADFHNYERKQRQGRY